MSAAHFLEARPQYGEKQDKWSDAAGKEHLRRTNASSAGWSLAADHLEDLPSNMINLQLSFTVNLIITSHWICLQSIKREH
jgi:hypothetical protein